MNNEVKLTDKVKLVRHCAAHMASPIISVISAVLVVSNAKVVRITSSIPCEETIVV